MSLPPDLLQRFLEYQQAEKEFKDRKGHFLASISETPDKLGDRVLAGLLEDEGALRDRRDALAREVKERLGFDL